MNFIASTAAFVAVPTTAPAMPTDPSDQSLVDAANGLIAADEAIERIHREHGASGAKGDADERTDYQALENARNEYITTLITVPAASTVGTQAKAIVLRNQRMIEDWDQHQQIAVSLADDLVGESSPPAPDGERDAPDPIYDLIEKHRAAITAHREAVRIEFGFEEDRVCVRDMDPETLKEYRVLQSASCEAIDRMFDIGAELLNTPPTTLAGIAALCQHLHSQFEPEYGGDTCDFPDRIDWDDGTSSVPAAAFANVLRVSVERMLKAA